jgi:hypothetical protein
MDRSWDGKATLTFMTATASQVEALGIQKNKKHSAIQGDSSLDTIPPPCIIPRIQHGGLCRPMTTHTRMFVQIFNPPPRLLYVFAVWYGPYLKSHNSPFHWNFFSLSFTLLVCDTQLAAIFHAYDDLAISLYPIAASTIIIQNFVVALLSLILTWIWLDAISNGLP